MNTNEEKKEVIKRVSLLIFGVLLMSCCHQQKIKKVLLKYTDRHYKATVLIVADNQGCTSVRTLQDVKTCLEFGPASSGPATGTGFWIDEHIIATASHVALFAEYTPQSHVVLTDQFGDHKQITVTNWVHDDVEDLAFGVVDAAPPHNVFELCDSIYIGEQAIAHGLSPDLQPPSVKAQVSWRQGAYIHFRGNIRPGFSGGPLESKARRCALGVITGAMSLREPLHAIGIASPFIRDTLKHLYESAQLPKNSS